MSQSHVNSSIRVSGWDQSASWIESNPLADASDTDLNNSEPARAAHRAVVARLAARVDRALLFFLEELNQFSNRRFFDTKAFLAGMIC